MNIDDDATATEELFNRVAIYNARVKAKKLTATGRCLWCEESVDGGRKFCDSDCSADFDKHSKRITG